MDCWNDSSFGLPTHKQKTNTPKKGKTMKKVMAVFALVAGLALPAIAETPESQTVNISHEELSSEQGPVLFHKVEGRSGLLDGSIRTSIDGYFLWVQYGGVGNGTDDLTTVSVDISDPSITQAIVYLDGTVELVKEETRPAPETPVESIDLVEEHPQVDWETVSNRLRAFGPVVE